MWEIGLVDAFEFFLAAMVLLGVLTQVVVPLVRHRPLFPILRKQPNLDEELARAKEKEDKVKLRKRIAGVLKRTNPPSGRNSSLKEGSSAPTS